MRRGLLLLSLLGFAHRALAADDSIEGPVPEEIAALRAASERFGARMDEVDADTRAFMELRRAEERERLVGGYDALIDKLEQDEGTQRALVIQRFEEFLEKYPSAQYSSHVRFRLADLYYEVAALTYIQESAAYYAALEGDDLEAAENLVEPRKDLSKPIALYRRIIEENEKLSPEERYERLDGVYLMLGFCYSDESSAQLDRELARAAYEDLIRALPESDLADRSHLFLGNFLFADGEFDAAIAEYRFVFEKGEEGRFYTDALYQLAWANYKQSRFDEATGQFLLLLDKSEIEKRDTGKESPYARDTVKYMAYSFADIANQDGRSAVEVARSFFAREGAREFEWDVYVELANVLLRYYRFDEAIEVYAALQEDPRWVNRPENPGFQIAIVQLYSQPAMNDLVRAGEARVVLTERYNEGGSWWVANRSDPDALAKAREFIEGSLLDVAIEYYVRADESQVPQDYLVAAEKYQEYLDKFPISDDYYQQQWFLANAYRKGGAWADAEREFEALRKSARYHPYLDGVVWFLMVVRQQRMLQESGPPDQPPVGGIVRETVDLPTGEVLSVFELSDARKAFVASADMALAHEFGPYDETIEGLPDVKSAIDEKRPALMYVPAQMLYYHNQFDEARDRFLALIDAYPRSVEASYAAGLLVDSFTRVGDLEHVREYSKRFTLSPPGPLTEVADDKFLDTLEGASFKLANKLAEGGDHTGAAEAFLAFVDEFPRSEYAPTALHNAAFEYQEVGKKERANELYEQFVKKYPSHEFARALYFRIAANYEATFDLARAVSYYDELRKRFPDDKNADDALYNASSLRIGLGQYKDAAQGFERYAKDYPQAEDREKVVWMAADPWKQVSDAEAMRFYQRYLDQYGTTNPDHALEALYGIAEIHQAQGKTAAYDKQLDQVEKTFDDLVASGAAIGPQGHRYAAIAAFRQIQKDFDTYTRDSLTGNEDKDATLVNDTKPAEYKQFEAETNAFVQKYRSFEHQTHALYMQGMGVLYLADLGLAIRPPKGLDEEQQFLYMELLQEKVFPKFFELEKVGVQKLSELIKLARDQKRHSEWIDAAYAELNKREPLDYPAVKLEVRGTPDTRIPQVIRPLEMPAPAGPWEGEGGKKGKGG